MTITLILNTTLIITGLWVGVAGLVGWRRFDCRPLITMAIGGFLVVGSVMLIILHIPGSQYVTDLALLTSALFNLMAAPAWHRRGITARQVFLFASANDISVSTQRHDDQVR